jgi:hypothetical protein
MNTKVHYFVQGLFRNMEETAEIAEQRQELESHITDHIVDLAAGGMGEEEAFTRSVDSLGNLNELIETLSGQKVQIPINKHILTVYGLILLYGVLYVAGMVLDFNRMGLGVVSLFVGPGGFLAYFVPFLNVLVKFIKYPGAMEAVSTNTKSAVKNAFTGWILISLGCCIMNIIMIRYSVVGAYWAWMPTMGVFTWPFMNSINAYFIRKGK